MTVEEAKNKWCCTHEIEKCFADECMAWRWFDTEIKTDGYCGLAGTVVFILARRGLNSNSFLQKLILNVVI